jgi:hypothetical protein
MLPQRIETHKPSIAQLILSVFGLGNYLFSALMLWLILKIGSTSQPIEADILSQASLLIGVALLFALFFIPSLILSIRRLARLSMPAARTDLLLPASLAFILLMPAVYLLYKFPAILDAPFLKVLITALIVAIPLWWYIEVGRRHLYSGSSQRIWGLANFEVWVSLPLIIFLEIALFILIMVVAGVWLSEKSTLISLWMTFQTQLMLDPQDLSYLQNEITELLHMPGTLVAIFFGISVAVPLVEEFFKPFALWFFIKHEWTGVEGFTAGLISGAAFAFVESFMILLSTSTDTWLVTLVARLGTGLLHCLTAGISGWALVSAWHNKKFIRLGIIYLVCVLLHGIWNFFALLFGVESKITSSLLENSTFWSAIAPWVLGLLFVSMLLFLFIFNRKLCKSCTPPPIPPLLDVTIG